MKRTAPDLGCQPSKCDEFIRVFIQIVSGLLDPLFCLGAIKRLGPTAMTGTISRRLRPVRRIEKRHVVASRPAGRTRRAAIDSRRRDRVDEAAIAMTITVQHECPRMVCID
jgi:hypothetical protein